MKQITITEAAAAPAAQSPPPNLPSTGGSDMAGILWACALAFLVAGVLLRKRA
jgi:LPXTG-motif cell wall-anchored protein